MAGTIQKLLFVDTNIWLDFYRTRSDAGLALLKHAEAVSSRIIVTYQLESEFKKNRQAAIVEGMQELKAPQQIPRPGLFSDVAATKIMNRSIKEAEKRVKDLRARFVRAIENPSAHDPVYQACQRIFHKDDTLVLTREDKIRHTIRRKAFRRFLHGCPPRKRTDTSLGDAFNWEWIVYCAIQQNAEIVIVSRDADYGITIDNKAYINDHLKQEFNERVSKKRKVILHNRLSEALKLFEIPISKQLEEAESEIVKVSAEGQVRNADPSYDWAAIMQSLGSLRSLNFDSDLLKGMQSWSGLSSSDIFGTLKGLQIPPSPKPSNEK
ncbi:MAG: PIN domain-containing protein [Terracidiphilus sp.]|nr:PIN domain-containing protein [Terracidiphilus sp.]